MFLSESVEEGIEGVYKIFGMRLVKYLVERGGAERFSYPTGSTPDQ